MTLNKTNGGHMNNTQQTNKKTLFIIIAIIAVVCVVVGIFLLAGKDDDSGKTNSLNSFGNEYTGSKRNVNIATIGHQGHGKSTLTSAITKFFGNYVTADTISSAQEVNKNGISFKAAFVEYETDNTHFSHYDLPSHSDYQKALLSGSIKLDSAILVIAATDGQLPQTREQLEMIQATGVSKIVVYISKCDLVDDVELIDLVEDEIRVLISEYGFDQDNTPIIRGSALKAIEGDKTEENGIRNLIESAEKWIDSSNNNQTQPSSTVKVKANVYLLSQDEGGITGGYEPNSKLSISIDGSKASGVVSFEEGVDSVLNGDNQHFTFSLDEELSVRKGEYFQVYDSDKLVGVGIITEILN